MYLLPNGILLYQSVEMSMWLDQLKKDKLINILFVYYNCSVFNIVFVILRNVNTFKKQYSYIISWNI